MTSRLVPEVDFDAPGTQRGFVRLFHSVHRSAYGYIPIPIVVLNNGPGPTALFVSGTHGDEYEGQVALCNLARTLDPASIKGRVILLPAANLPAAIAGTRTSPIDDGNLNRLFPGDPEGGVTEQIADFIETELVARADIVVDLHSGGSSLHYVPSALMMQDDENPARQAALVAALRAFASPIAYVGHASPGQGAVRTTSGAALRHGKLCLGTELGGSGTVTRAALEVAERGLRNVLAHVGITPARNRPAPAPPASWTSPAPTTSSTPPAPASTNPSSNPATPSPPDSPRPASTPPRNPLDPRRNHPLRPRRLRPLQTNPRPNHPRRLPLPPRHRPVKSSSPACGRGPG